ncbi:MAG: DUF1559 domain-containing protein [Planctomycetaceae bacterium]
MKLKPRITLKMFGCLVVLVLLVIPGIVSMFRTCSDTLTLVGAQNGLKNVGLALHQYHDAHGCFPPAVTYDESGEPKHSWRSLDKRSFTSTPETDSYEMSQPWDSPHNLALNAKLEFMPLAVVGPHAAWSPSGTRSRKDFTDGTSYSVVAIAPRNSGVGRREPRDAVFDDGELTLDGEPLDISQDLFLLFADGSLRYYRGGISQETLFPLLTIDGGEEVEPY